jgi:predicted permease
MPIRSFRILARHWKLTAIAVVSLSVAIALGVLSLSIANTFLLLPPAAAEPDRLVAIYSRADPSSVDQISYPDFEYYRRNNHVFTDVAAAPNSIGVVADFDVRTIKLFSRPVSDNYFAVMGIHPFLGHFFEPGDDRAGKQIAVMTWACWRRLGGDRQIVGKVIAGNTIVGVTPKEFTGSFYGVNGDILTPLGSEYTSGRSSSREARRLFLTARLKPGVTRQQAQAEMTALSAQLAAAWPKEDGKRTAVVTRATLLPPDGAKDALLALGILLGVVALVLLIACANVANLLLAIAVGRRQEACIKLALGAPRARLIREFLRESAVLCIAAGVIGYALAALVIARFGTVTFVLPIFGEFSFGINLRLDLTVAAFTALMIGLAILVTGLAPALYAASPNIAQALGGEIVVGGTRKNLRRSALAVAQIAICTLVLIGMGLCQRSLYNLRHVDPGFASRDLAAVQIYLNGSGYSEAKGRELYRNLRDRIAALPGVESVGMATALPLMGGPSDEMQTPGGNKASVSHAAVDGNYFATFGIPVLAGRTFGSEDREGGPPVAVVNRKLAETFWPGRDPVGQTVLTGTPPRAITVVGMVRDGKYEDLDESPRPFLYYALSQNYQEEIDVVARTAGDPEQWLKPLSRVLHDLAVPAPMAPFTFENWVNLTLLQERIVAGCVGGLSALGLLLAVIGLFGAISYSVSERKKELGIRVALGARRAQLLRMVLRETCRIAGIGIVLGSLLGVGVTVVVQSMLYDIEMVEWGVLLAVGALMLAVSLIVAYVSARPWTAVDPMEAVRHA